MDRLILTFYCMMLCLGAYSQLDSTRTSPSIYERYKVALDRGDTLKFKTPISFIGARGSEEDCSGTYHLTQIIKKNDSILIINQMELPCLIEHTAISRYNKYGFPENIEMFNTMLQNKKMPSIQSFDKTPFSIEVPIQIQNLRNYNIQGTTGKITIINTRKDIEGKAIIYNNTPTYLEFTFEDVLLNEYCNHSYRSVNDNLSTVEKIFRDYLFSGNYSFFNRNFDFFDPNFKYRYGDAPTFYLDNIWAVYSTKHFVVILENISRYTYRDDEEDYVSMFRRMAKSIKPIEPIMFNLQDLDNYILLD